MKPSRPTCVAVLTAALTLAHVATAGAFSPSAGDSAENTPLSLGSTARTHSASAGSGDSIVRTLLGLVLVVGLIYGVTWVLRKIKRHEGRAVGTGLESVASLPLGPGRSLALVRAGSDLVLVGVAEQQVTAIRRYTEAEARAAGLLDDVLAEPVRVDTLTSARAGTLSRSMGADPPPADLSLNGLLDVVRRWTVR